jgi:hypothetical protein
MPHCLFCGVLPREAPRVAHLSNLVCQVCFEQIGITFRAKGEKTREVLTEYCLSCGRNERRRQLVGGVAAAICQPCYRRAVRQRMPLAQKALKKARPRAAELRVSRATVLEIRKQYNKQKRLLRPNHRRTPAVTLIMMVLEEDRLSHRIRSHLAVLEPGPESEKAQHAQVPQRRKGRGGKPGPKGHSVRTGVTPSTGSSSLSSGRSNRKAALDELRRRGSKSSVGD